MKNNASKTLTWENAPEVLTVREAAQLIRISPNECYKSIRRGTLPAVNFGERKTRIHKQVLRRVFGEQLELTAVFNHLPEA